MMGHDNARLSQQKVEGKIFQAVEGVPARKNRKAAIFHDCDVPYIPDSRLGILGVHGSNLRIDSRKKSVALENLRAIGRENALREDHDGIVVDLSPCFMVAHSRSSQLGLVVQGLDRSRSKFARSVIAAMNGYRKV